MGWLPALALLILARLGVNYNIDAGLDESRHEVRGRSRITIVNQDDRPLDTVWIHLHPEAFSSRNTDFAREMEGMENFELAWASPKQLGGITIDSLASTSHSVRLEPHGTEAALLVSPPLSPGDTLRLYTGFTTRVPDFFFERFGCRGRTFLLSHWYPMVAALDRDGWHIGGVHPAGWAPGHVADYVVGLVLPRDQVLAAPGQSVMTRPALEHEGTSYGRQINGVSEFAWACSPDWSVRPSRGAGTVYTRRRNSNAWQDVPDRAREVASRCAAWYGPAPLGHPSIVDLSGIAPADAHFPGLATVTTSGIPFTRMLERAVCRQVALAWFSAPAAPEPLGSSWLSLGPAVMTEVRWLEETYGNTNLLDLPWAGPLAGLGDRYWHRAAWYLAETNGALGSIARPEFDYTTNPFSYSEGRFSHAGSFFLMLRGQLGPQVFDRACREYIGRGDDGRTAREAFVDACAAASARDVSWLFDRWFENTGTCDYAVTGTRRRGDDIEVDIARRGDITMPVEVELLFGDGTTRRRTWDLAAESGTLRHASPKRLRRVTLDPDEKLLEPDRWNNHWPRRAKVHPLFALPDFDAYQFFWGPYPWYDGYHGLQLGGWVQGRQFIDAGPLRGRHSWSASLFWATKLEQLQGGAWYQTPLDFISDRLRVITAARYAAKMASADVIFEQGLSPVLRQSGTTVQLAWNLVDLKDRVGRDPRAWDEARTSELGMRLLHSYNRKHFRGNGAVYLGAGLTELGGHHDYWKAGIEQVHTLRLARNLGITGRLFLGALTAPGPQQAEFFLSGGLIADADEPVSWAYEGWASGQEHWHYDSDVNCRGWAGDYVHGRYAWGVNLSLDAVPVVRPFLDIGNVADDPLGTELWRPRLAAGVKLKLAWFYAAFPLWRWQVGDEPQLVFDRDWDSAKWMMGLNFAGFADF